MPEQPLPAAPPTPQRIMPRTGQHALAIGLLGHEARGPRNQPTQRHHQRGAPPLHLFGLARGLQTIIAQAMEPFRQNMLDQPPNARQRRDLVLLPWLGLVIVLPVSHPLPIVAPEASEGERRADDILRQVVR